MFVADGYCNSRVVQYAADGTFVQQYTHPEVRQRCLYWPHQCRDDIPTHGRVQGVIDCPGVGRALMLLRNAQAEMQIPHGLVVDDCRRALYVADRERATVHRFRLTADRQPPAAPAARPDKASADTGTRLRMRRRRRLQSGSAAQGIGSLQAATSLAASAPGWQQQQRQRRRAVLQEPGAAVDAGGAGPEGSTDPSAAAGTGAGDTGEGDGAGMISGFSGAEEDAQPGVGTAPDMTADLSEYGPVYGLTAGPYGSLLALCWDRGADRVWLLLLDFSSGALSRPAKKIPDTHLLRCPRSCQSHRLCAWNNMLVCSAQSASKMKCS